MQFSAQDRRLLALRNENAALWKWCVVTGWFHFESVSWCG